MNKLILIVFLLCTSKLFSQDIHCSNIDYRLLKFIIKKDNNCIIDTSKYDVKNEAAMYRQMFFRTNFGYSPLYLFRYDTSKLLNKH